MSPAEKTTPPVLDAAAAELAFRISRHYGVYVDHELLSALKDFARAAVDDGQRRVEALDGERLRDLEELTSMLAGAAAWRALAPEMQLGALRFMNQPVATKLEPALKAARSALASLVRATVTTPAGVSLELRIQELEAELAKARANLAVSEALIKERGCDS
jgi:hypothetical protein